MRKWPLLSFASFIPITLMLVATSGCATLQSARVKAVDLLCANQTVLTAIALSNNDIATVKAIDAYCAPTPAPVN